MHNGQILSHAAVRTSVATWTKMRVCRGTITHGLNLLLPRGRHRDQLRVKDEGREGEGQKERAEKTTREMQRNLTMERKKNPTPSTGNVPAKWNTHMRDFKNMKRCFFGFFLSVRDPHTTIRREKKIKLL